ncbi:MAG: pyridoxal phosphate-dependent aminotransferase [Lachnospiraceae bacterium]|nr:pyridoxal phosphate-dependent aminotransferase [Lachnospiraceae bacterium]
MFAEKMVELGSKRSTIREIFEFGNKRAAQVGRENIFDFSLGNPNVPAPKSVSDTIVRLVKEEDAAALHGYTSAQGDAMVRNRIAKSLNEIHGTHFTGDNLYMTVGAAASLCVCFKALAQEGDEFIAFAPYFPEYKVFAEGVGAKFVVVPADPDSFQINFAAFEKQLTSKTKAVVVNSPNNPTGVVYSEETILKLVKLLKEKSQEYGHPIYLISDEPYREIVFDGVGVPYLTQYYDNTFVCYSYSKSLSMPGERIGYIVVPDEMEGAKEAYAAVCGAGRVLGYVCAPALFQRVASECAGQTSDVAVYQKNRDLLYHALVSMGYSCVKPEGAFYLFPRSLEPDAYAFCEKAKSLDLLLVPGDDFDCPGHVRIAYCVKTEMIERSLAAFEKLAAMYR